MSRYTAELRTIIDNDFDIFDFTFNRTEASKAIISDEKLKEGFINHYYFREIGFETLERFKHFLKTKWLENLGEFDSLLVAYNEPINVKANLGSSVDNKSVFNDTPKNALDDSKDYATSITDNKQKTAGFAGITEVEMLEIYHNNIRDIQTEFYEKFDSLFMQVF